MATLGVRGLINYPDGRILQLPPGRAFACSKRV